MIIVFMSLKLIFSGSTNISFNFLKFLKFKKVIFKFLFIGTDYNLNFNILKIFCFKKNLIFFQFKNIFFYNNNLKYNIYLYIKIKKINFNISIILDYWMIFSIFILRLPLYGFFNFHSSILPFYKGFSPKIYIFYNKNLNFGISLIIISLYIDLGFLIFYLKFLNFFYIFYFFIFNIFYLKIFFFFF
ncbi:hypothetical protein CU086_00520 [Candidatus Nasuia deltocephalinicola]|uniref:Uncharacterized protein n=1 Tax=Candidatus Nasuia deltocephalincola TaxID=1160784 RepID=A0A975A421_9PROT|nr:hypothetical protein CU086_00520 [Candidatus Nasuia deltocephalinicola]